MSVDTLVEEEEHDRLEAAADAADAPAAPSSGVPWGRVALGIGKHLGVIALFAVPAVVLWWHVWDGHAASRLACACGDSGQEVWFIAWPAYALAHGHNPFFTTWLNAPRGTNLLANTSSPLVGTALAPVTWLFGPIAATNVALTLTPALSAWGAWVACRRLTGWSPAAFVAGLLFGYSPVVVSNVATGHVYMGLLVALPLMLLVAHELLVTQRGNPWRWGVALGLLVVVQFFISTEVLTMAALVAIVGVVAWIVAAPRALPGRLPFAARGVLAGALVAGVLLAYPAWFALAGPRHLTGAPWELLAIAGNRLSDVWNPGAYRAPASGIVRLGGYEGLAGPTFAYLGFGVLALAGASLVVAWRRRLAWVSAALALVTLWLSLGSLFYESNGRYTTGRWLPWRTLSTLPILDKILPARFSAFTDLFVAVLIALGLAAAYRRATARAGRRTPAATVDGGAGARAGRGRRMGLTAVAAAVLVGVSLAALVPVWRTYQVPLATTTVRPPAWFATAATTVRPGSVVLVYPFPTPSTDTSGPMVWQAEDGMRFRLAGGYVKIPGPDGRALDAGPPHSVTRTLAALSALAAGPLPAGTTRQLAEVQGAVRRWHVDEVVVTRQGGRDPAYAAALFTAALGRLPSLSHGAWVWPVARGAAPRPAAAARALRACVTAPGVVRGVGAGLTQAGNACVIGHLKAR